MFNIKVKKSSFSIEKIGKSSKEVENMKDEKLKLTFSSKTKQGINLSGMKKTNQDSFLIKTSIFSLNDFSIFGVFDGHGRR